MNDIELSSGLGDVDNGTSVRDNEREGRKAPPQKIELTNFPHPPRQGASYLPATLENLEFLLRQGDFYPRFNVIKKRLEVRRGDGAVASMNEVVSYALLQGMGTGYLYQFVDEIAATRAYNPIKDWILGVPWDGADRLRAITETVRQAEGYPDGLKDALIYRWLLSATAAALTNSRFRTRGVLTLQGDQGIGKTTWIAQLLPAGTLRNEHIKLDHHLDGGNKDSIIGAITHWITEIGELDSSFKKDIARLKGFLTNDCDKLRRPYAKDEAEYARRTVFAATVNEESFLIDPTGNSRWWTIAVRSLDHKHDVDMQQLYAQLAVDFYRGEPWWLSPEEERQLAAYNVKHRSVSAIAERIRDYVDLDAIGNPGGVAKTAIEVLSDIGISNPTNAQCKECGGVLRELFGAPKRINGRDKWRIPARTVQGDYRSVSLADETY